MHEPLDHDSDSIDLASPERPLSRRHGASGTLGVILMAAMMGLADALGWDKGRSNGEIIQLAPDLTTGDLPLDFGPLPPLD